MTQPLADLEKWFLKKDPWEYENNLEDIKRKDILLSEIPERNYKKVLDIGCGHGFVTRSLPGEEIVGVDISKNAIKQAQRNNRSKKIKYVQASIYNLSILGSQKFDLIILTGVLYPQYIGDSESLIYTIIDRYLADSGILIMVHIDEWYKARFPYLLLKEYLYSYKEYTHRLEVYTK